MASVVLVERWTWNGSCLPVATNVNSIAEAFGKYLNLSRLTEQVQSQYFDLSLQVLKLSSVLTACTEKLHKSLVRWRIAVNGLDSASE